MVVGLWIVKSGVLTLGVEGPKAPMVLGTNNLNLCNLANSATLWKPLMLISKAFSGNFSPTADNKAEK